MISLCFVVDWFDGYSVWFWLFEVWVDGDVLCFGEQQVLLRVVIWLECQCYGQWQILLFGGGLLSFVDVVVFDVWVVVLGCGDSFVVCWQQSWWLVVLLLVLLVVGFVLVYCWGLLWVVDVVVDVLLCLIEYVISWQLLSSLDG